MYIYLLIQTLQCEQKHIIHESLLQTYNSSVSQLFFALNDYDAITNIIPVSRKFACMLFYIGGFLFVRYCHKAFWDVLGAIVGSVEN